MAKGTRLERTSQFIHDAHTAGLSVRTTMMLGYPGETAEDLRDTIAFVQEHRHALDRIHLSLFKAIPGTRFAERYARRPDQYEVLRRFRWNPRLGRASYRNHEAANRTYRRAKHEFLALVHDINRRPLSHGAVVFDGLM